MDVTLLGSGDAVGVPAPLCNCSYCTDSPRRRRPGLLVETERATVVLDVSPEIKEQLHRAAVCEVDGFFLTHHHYDHVGGLDELAHAAMGFDSHVGIEDGYLSPETFTVDEKPKNPVVTVYLTPTALGRITDSNPRLTNTVEFRTIDHGTAVTVGDLRIVPFPVQHSRPQFDTLGFAIHHVGSNVVYAPDMWSFMDDVEYTAADILFVEGAALFRAFGHGEESDLRSALQTADAERTVLLNLNEYLQRMTTKEMEAVVAQDGYELGSDFATYRL
ncbi:MBL fold metallo-hydrolase [Halocatena halophila]|uniref:MBL fold metallo-hydrolase n=1 Tax=Halocatena halophila TaxID=2814576 RepID=UPI002ED55D80